jgi:hypothetical protein
MKSASRKPVKRTKKKNMTVTPHEAVAIDCLLKAYIQMTDQILRYFRCHDLTDTQIKKAFMDIMSETP